MSWFAAPAIVKLNQEIQAKWPNRDTGSDGVVGDTSHQARPSDHNPDPPPNGIVRATDRDIDGWPAKACRDYILSRCRSGAERRLQYVINDRTIWSASWGWAPKPYTGDNPHLAHIHFSLKHDSSNYDTSPWLPSFPSPVTPPAEEDDMPYTPDQIAKIVRDAVDDRIRYLGPRLLAAAFTGQGNAAFAGDDGEFSHGWDLTGGPFAPLMHSDTRLRVQVEGKPAQYLVANGLRRWLTDPKDVVESGALGLKIIKVTPEQLARIPLVGPDAPTA
jgi:hypothetical protein